MWFSGPLKFEEPEFVALPFDLFLDIQFLNWYVIDIGSADIVVGYYNIKL